MKRFLYIVVYLFAVLSINAQQVPLYSQYMMNGFLLNPAVAGSEGYTAINLTAREQWLGLKNAPKTHAVSVQTRMVKNSYISKAASVKKRRRLSSRSGKVGFGGYVYNDKNGAIDRTGIQLSYAYHIRMKTSQLSFGISGIAYQFSVDDDYITFEEQDDFYNFAQKSIFIPDASVGVYYSDPNLYLSMSVSQIFQSSLRLGEKGYAEYKMKRYYFISGGYDVAVNDVLTLSPSFLLKTTEDLSYQIDFGSRLIFNEEYWGGLTYRTGGAIIIMGGVRVEKYFFGYSFDYTLSSIMKRSYGSHEFMIAVHFGDNVRRFRWMNRY